MSEDKKPFTVKDRRHFTSEGDAREEAPEVTAEPDPRPAPLPPAEPSPELPPPGAPPDEMEGPGRRFPADFTSLLVTLGTQGSMLLAGVQPGQDVAGPPDLEGARDVISLLETLQSKTEGRLTPDEDRLLSGILYELRMGFVAVRKAPRA